MSRSWIVGGALRDELLGREVTDIDIAVEGDPASAARERADQVRGPVFRLSEAFGAWRVVDGRGGRIYDFAPLQGATIEEDLRKRDFTVNAMAGELAEEGISSGVAGGELIDPLGGRSDLESRTLRVLGPEAYAFSQRYYQSRELDVLDELARRRIRYVVARRFPSDLEDAPGEDSLFQALFHRDGSEGLDPETGAVRMPALSRHRLLYETLGRDFTDKDAGAVYKLFEVVAGAVVTGRAAPGRVVEVSLALRTNRGRSVRYQTRVAADTQGRYRVRLPHATAGGPEGLKAAPFYRFACGDDVGGLQVGEPAVQQGLELRGPDLCLDGKEAG